MTTLLWVISLVPAMGRPLSRAPRSWVWVLPMTHLGNSSQEHHFWDKWPTQPEALWLIFPAKLSSRTNSSSNTAGCLSRCNLGDRCWFKKLLPRLYVSNFKKWRGFWLGLHQVHTFEKLDIFTILRLPIQKSRMFTPLFKILTVF